VIFVSFDPLSGALSLSIRSGVDRFRSHGCITLHTVGSSPAPQCLIHEAFPGEARPTWNSAV
ncbi:hypothetical protein, partial [Paracoccus benzoatiresistens]